MIQLKRYLKLDGIKYKPGKQLELTPELEEKYVKSGTAEFIRPIEKRTAVRKSNSTVTEQSETVDTSLQDIYNPVKPQKNTEPIIHDTDSVNDETTEIDGEVISDDEEVNDSEVFAEDDDVTDDMEAVAADDFKVNFDEDEYISASNKNNGYNHQKKKK